MKKTHEVTSHWEDLETALRGIGLNDSDTLLLMEHAHELSQDRPVIWSDDDIAALFAGDNKGA